VTGYSTRTNIAHFVYVALDNDKRPTPVPPLIPITEEEKDRMEHGRQRQAYRLAQRAAERGA